MKRAIPWTFLLAACARPPAGGGEAFGPRDPSWVAEVRVPDALGRPPRALEEEIALCIADLGAAEFEASSRAAGRLVGLGVPAAPYVGYAAERTPGEAVRELHIVLDAILFAAPPEQVALLLASPYPAVRSAAAGACGERRLVELGPGLVDLLEDKELAVRRAGIAALRMLANQFYGYRPDDPPGRRTAAVARWREHWKAG
jgi:hypothetical protein